MDHYQTLQVGTDFTPAQLKLAYLRSARLCHPDIVTGPEAEAQFKLISEAFAVLSDSRRRAEYDLERGETRVFVAPADESDGPELFEGPGLMPKSIERSVGAIWRMVRAFGRVVRALINLDPDADNWGAIVEWSKRTHAATAAWIKRTFGTGHQTRI